MGHFLTHHALQRLAQRGITKSMVKKCLQSPDTTGDDFVLKKISGRQLKVIFQRKGNHEIIITAYFLS